MVRAPFQVLVYPYRVLAPGAAEYALLRRSDNGWWQGVAGGGEDAESPVEAAAREAHEEIGTPLDAPLLPLDTVFSVPVTEFRARVQWDPDLFVIPCRCFGLALDVPALRLSHEHVESRWLAYADARDLLRFDGDRTALWELDQRLRSVARPL
jgi:dihydroneopterin triphosphate diphosphatase